MPSLNPEIKWRHAPWHAATPGALHGFFTVVAGLAQVWSGGVQQVTTRQQCPSVTVKSAFTWRRVPRAFAKLHAPVVWGRVQGL